MATIYPFAYFGTEILPFNEAHLSIASSAVLYGLSVYTVLAVQCTEAEELLAFRLHDHYQRLADSAHIIGIDQFKKEWNEELFITAVKKVIQVNSIKENVLLRATVHVKELLPGTRSRGLEIVVSIFIYQNSPLLPLNGARLKSSVWRRTPDYAIPSRAKVNGAYVNSVLAKQDALDSGYDDCLFLDSGGHVCELSAANIFIVRHNTLITPDTTSDLLEGITRRTILQLAKDRGIAVMERSIDLTELYIADEVFACGTSTFITPIIEVDARKINHQKVGPITLQLKKKFSEIVAGQDTAYASFITRL